MLDATPTDEGSAARAELVHDGPRARVTRLFLTDRTVILKEPRGPDAQRRLEHEAAVLEQLRGIPGVAQLLHEPHEPGQLALEDAGPATLRSLPLPLGIDELAPIALALAQAVARMHAHGIVHRDITPANVVLSSDRAPCLVDFALATPLSEARQQFTARGEAAGTPAYLAPEQTGRVARPVDHRSDLYALGTCLYELATGEPPFGSGDPVRLAHDHLARLPTPPEQRNPEIPTLLSEILVHLLEKEPDDRYQTAEGLVADLSRLPGPAATPPAAPIPRVGASDVRLEPPSPSRMAGRGRELAELRNGFEEMLVGRCRAVVVSGARGTGKTALAEQLRSVVGGRAGWFLAGRFDRSRRDLEFDAVFQVFSALGRRLLAEPEERVAAARRGLLDALGSTAGQVAATVPELAALLGVAPDPGDPLTAEAQATRNAYKMLRSVTDIVQPVVVFLDDLQWASRPPLSFVDLVLSEAQIPGLLLVATYRDDDQDTPPSTAAKVAGWREQQGVRHVPLKNLSPSGMTELVADIVRREPEAVAGLVELIEPYTLGNPGATVELLARLRRERVLSVTSEGFAWEPEIVRARLTPRLRTGDLHSARLGALPPTSRQLVEAMACLADRTSFSLLGIATGQTAEAVETQLEPAISEGLLIACSGPDGAVRFAQDQIREVALRSIDRPRRRSLQLAMARRLAAEPDLFAVAAEQYLSVTDDLNDDDERRSVVELLRRGAEQAALVGDHGRADALLTSALALADTGDTSTILEIRLRRHAARHSLGRLEEADAEYDAIEALEPGPAAHADATALRVLRLAHRMQLGDSLQLGLQALRELGVDVAVPQDLSCGLDERFDLLQRWLDDSEHLDDAEHSGTHGQDGLGDPLLTGKARLLNATQASASLLGQQSLVSWLALEGVRIWLEDGADPSLLGLVGVAAYQAVVCRQDELGDAALRRAVALGRRNGWEPGVSQASYLQSLLAWQHEPIPAAMEAVERARQGLIAGGDLANAAYSFLETTRYLLVCAPSLDRYEAEVNAATSFTQRAGVDQVDAWLDGDRWLISVLRGESDPGEAHSFTADRYAGNPVARFNAAYPRAVAAAIFGDMGMLSQQTAIAMEALGPDTGTVVTASTRMLRGLAVAEEARTASGDSRVTALSELEELTRWLADRTSGAPENFLHAVRWLEAEGAWAQGDLRGALVAFDAARGEVASEQLPLRRALITERAGRCLMTHGIEQSGRELLIDAHASYAAWGATGKVQQLESAYPNLRLPGPMGDAAREEGATARAPVPAGTVDLLGILAASQALSSETSVERLHARLAELLCSMTGATHAQLVLWKEESGDWLPAEHATPLPLSVLEYARRTRRPVMVADAATDERFAHDPSIAAAGARSLLVVPIVSRDTLRAVLLLENRFIRGAFSRERLDSVELLTGQLAVSLDNAGLYARYERIANEQAALRRVATLVARGVTSDAVFSAVADAAGSLFAADVSSIVRLEPDGQATAMGGHGVDDFVRGERSADSLTAAVRDTGRPVRRDAHDRSGELPDGIISAVAIPIVVEGRVWGVMSIGSRHERLPEDTAPRLAEFTALVGTAIANADSRAELTASRARIVNAADQARRRIQRDLHDGAQQRLVALQIRLQTLQARPPAGATELSAALQDAIDEASGAAEELRALAQGIHPAVLHAGLQAALKVLAGRAPMPVALQLETPSRMAEHLELSAYYIVAEALNNVAKHAHASKATVTISADSAQRLLEITVSDDGVGGADFEGGTGLVGLKDRADALGGSIELHGGPGVVGTTLRARLPLDSPML